MMHTITKQLDGTAMLLELLQWMESTFDDFPEIKTAYEDAVNSFKQSLDHELVQAETDAIMQQSISNLLFSCWLGFTANWEHFTDPVARNFLEADFEVFLQETVAHSLPDYEDAQAVRNRFYALLTEEQQTKYEAVISYACYLETTVPKLAHYFGYLLGNELLPKLVPGYQPDLIQTLRYNQILEHYLGQNCLPTATGYKLQDHM